MTARRNTAELAAATLGDPRWAAVLARVARIPKPAQETLRLAAPTSATVLLTAAHLGMPVSTTHAVSTSIMGVGTARSFKAMRWDLVESIVWTWVMTLPATGLIAFGLMRLVQFLGWS